jgi:hypothetical protein
MRYLTAASRIRYSDFRLTGTCASPRMRFGYSSSICTPVSLRNSARRLRVWPTLDRIDLLKCASRFPHSRYRRSSRPWLNERRTTAPRSGRRCVRRNTYLIRYCTTPSRRRRSVATLRSLMAPWRALWRVVFDAHGSGLSARDPLRLPNGWLNHALLRPIHLRRPAVRCLPLRNSCLEIFLVRRFPPTTGCRVTVIAWYRTPS